MTAQINDLFLFRGAKYCIAGISEGELFDPQLLGLNPVSSCSACWRGYQGYFALSEDRLVLDALRITLVEDEGHYVRRPGPVLNGVTPQEADGFFNNLYEDLNYHLEYTGGLLIGHGFIRELYVHMGFHPAWKYEDVWELVFQSGKICATKDRSQAMQEVRDQIQSWPVGERPSREEVRGLVQRAFDRAD